MGELVVLRPKRILDIMSATRLRIKSAATIESLLRREDMHLVTELTGSNQFLMENRLLIMILNQVSHYSLPQREELSNNLSRKVEKMDGHPSETRKYIGKMSEVFQMER